MGSVRGRRMGARGMREARQDCDEASQEVFADAAQAGVNP